MAKHITHQDSTIKKLEQHYADFLSTLLEKPHRKGLEQTPLRVAQTMLELTRGYKEDAIEQLRNGAFTQEQQKMIVVQNISFFSMCEHHLVPFFGKVHIAYIPNKLITGLSKITKTVDIFSHRFQVQERLTLQIMNAINTALQPKGVMIYITAQHMCMQMRGDEKQGSVVYTTNYCGAFKDVQLRNEFINMIKNPTSLP